MALTLGMIGAGHMGMLHARNLMADARVHMVGVTDVVPDRAEAMAQLCQGRTFANVEALLDADAKPNIHEFEIKGTSRTTVENLSGGNQQKVLLAKWLLMEPSVLFLDDPTRGIDVAAKADIYEIIQEAAGRGMGIIFVSSELAELLQCCDRIMVLHEGRNV